MCAWLPSGRGPGLRTGNEFSRQEQVFLIFPLVTPLGQVIAALSRCVHQQKCMMKSMHGRRWNLLQGNSNPYHYHRLKNTSEKYSSLWT